MAVRTNQFIIVGFYRAQMHPSVAVEAIEKLGRFLTGLKAADESKGDYFRKKGK